MSTAFIDSYCCRSFYGISIVSNILFVCQEPSAENHRVHCHSCKIKSLWQLVFLAFFVNNSECWNWIHLLEILELFIVWGDLFARPANALMFDTQLYYNACDMLMSDTSRLTQTFCYRARFLCIDYCSQHGTRHRHI